MTNDEFKKLKELLKNYPDKKSVIEYLEGKDKCLRCRYNDGIPHNACCDCDRF